MHTSTLPKATAGQLGRHRRLLVLAICCASVIVVVMDISIVNVALPTIRRDLRASVSGLQWTVDAYTLVLASFLVLAGPPLTGSAVGASSRSAWPSSGSARCCVAWRPASVG